MRHAARILVTIAVCLSLSSFAQIQADANRTRDEIDELLYLPNEKLLSHFTAGQSSLVASMLWLRCIQYTSKEFHRDRKFTWLERMCGVITDLDPYFVDAYKYGGMFLASIKGDDDASLNLLNKGIEHNPGRWELMWEAAMVYLLNRRNEPDSPELAAHYLAMAVRTGDAEPRVALTLEGLSRRHGLYEIERERWLDAAKSNDAMMRELAARKLEELELRQIVDALSAAARRFAAQHGRPLTSLKELVDEGLISHIPTDGMGGEFIVREGRVQNTTLLDSDLEARKNRLQAAIDRFTEHQGRPPKSLEELRDSVFLIRIPDHPYDREWRYDPVRGVVDG